ncbi:unnamed protein product [Cylindrotheca closterium]|uniref:Uncharacterized protein n=1 Tax=Cylindrotheca closterium TaxID=2856 RepID=A0AAD2G9X7_9STRA|nr:unnamed protein product [Cylindrotheca closterium]
MSNMENMLMDDSSSGESDDEVVVPTNRPVASAIAAAAAPQAAPVAAPRPAAVPPQPSAQDQQKERLKNLYRAQQTMRPQPSSAPMQPPPSLSESASPSMPGPGPGPGPGSHINHPGRRMSSGSYNSSHQRSYAPSPQQPTPTTQGGPQPPQMNMTRRPSQTRTQQPQMPQRSQPQMQQHPQMSSHSSAQYNPHSRSSHGSHPSQSSRSQMVPPQSARTSSHPTSHDPYAPAPYANMQSREQPRQTSMPSHTSRPSSSSSYPSAQPVNPSAPVQSSHSSSGRPPQQLSAQEQAAQATRRKRQYTLFTQVLLKRLEKENPSMHRAAKATIQECAIRNKKKQPGYESLTNALMPRLKELVGKPFWNTTQKVLHNHLAKHKSSEAIKQQQQQKAAQQQKLESQNQQQRQREAQVHAQRQAQLRQQQQQQAAQPNLSRLQQEVTNRKTEINRAAPTSSAAAAKLTSTQKKQALAKQRGRVTSPSPASRKPGTPAAATTLPPTKVEEPPKEYNELMQMVDQAVSYDYKTAGTLLKASKTDLHVDDEQKRLLYGDVKPKLPPPRTQGPRPGWDKTNVLSARAAWARVRLPEQPEAAPGVPMTRPSAARGQNDTSWAHEQKAEQDEVLALLSEASQHYLKDILRKAVHCSRQRQNVDGIRLWHQQHVSAVHGKEAPLSLRLGCDVSRQVAQVAGNAALTCKRMEEALERKSGVPASARILKEATLQEATSMGDLALKPQLGRGPANAELQARRSFEEYGGKHASEPPLGRVPKKAKVEIVDLVHGQTLLQTLGHRAVTSKVTSY